MTKQSPQSVVADYLLLDSAGTVLVELKDCRFRGVQLMRSAALLPASYEFQPFLMPLKDTTKASPIAEPAALVSNAVEFLKKS